MSDARRMHEIGEFVYFSPPIGRGSFAKVYRGYHRVTKQPVAVKRIVIKDVPHSHRHRVDSELEILGKVNHPNIIRLLDVQRDASGNVHIITELCEGGNLAQWLRKQHHHREGDDANRPSLDERDIQHVAVQLRDALQYLHSIGLLHRDLKPQNILIHYETLKPSHADIHNLRIKVCDFGFSKQHACTGETNDDDDEQGDAGQGPAMFQTLCGSPMYLAPEIALNQHYTTSSDLWSVGVMMYELITGRPPLHSCRHMLDLIHVMHSLQGSIQLPAQHIVSSACRDLIRSLLTVRPQDRITWDQFFAHPWFDQGLLRASGPRHNPQSLSESDLSSLALERHHDVFRVINEIDNPQLHEELSTQFHKSSSPIGIPGMNRQRQSTEYETRIHYPGTPILDDYTDSCSSGSAPGFFSPSAPRSFGSSTHSPNSPGWLASVSGAVGSYGTSLPHLNRFFSDSVQTIKGTLGLSKSP